MNDSALTGLLVGLFIGGFIGSLVMAFAAAGSKHRSRDGLQGDTRPPVLRARPGQSWAESSMSIDLLPLGEVALVEEPPIAEGDDIDQEMRELMRRYGRPSES
jgi:hypothetical protein